MVVSGSLAGERFPLGPGDTRIGRAPARISNLRRRARLGSTAWCARATAATTSSIDALARGPLSMECALANTGSNPATR